MPTDIIAETSAILEQAWGEITSLAEQSQLQDWLNDDTLVESIRRSVNSTTRSYRYVLPTQLIAKLADPSLDCRCLQVVRGGPGAFDARTIAHRVVVPFDQTNDNVLGGSPEPYVNNPLRVPEISAQYRDAQRNRQDWDHLCHVLGIVEGRQDKDFTGSVVKQVLTEVYRRLSEVRVVYPTPMRISLSRCMQLIQDYLGTPSGGDRLLALTSALFEVIGRRFQLYTEVRRGTITASDQATGMVADLECVSGDESIVLAVEVRDKVLTISQMRSKIPSMREKQVSEIFFVAQQGVDETDKDEVQALKNQEFTAGHNIFITTFTNLAHVALALLGESGRHDFLAEVAAQLERYRADIQHRRAWAHLLGAI